MQCKLAQIFTVHLENLEYYMIIVLIKMPHSAKTFYQPFVHLCLRAHMRTGLMKVQVIVTHSNVLKADGIITAFLLPESFLLYYFVGCWSFK